MESNPLLLIRTTEAILRLIQLLLLALTLWLGTLLDGWWPDANPIVTEAVAVLVLWVVSEFLAAVVFARPTVRINLRYLGSSVSVREVSISTRGFARSSDQLELSVTASVVGLFGRWFLGRALGHGLKFVLDVADAPVQCVVDYSAPLDEPDAQKRVVRAVDKSQLTIVPTTRPHRVSWVYAKITYRARVRATDQPFGVTPKAVVAGSKGKWSAAVLKLHCDLEKIVIHR